MDQTNQERRINLYISLYLFFNCISAASVLTSNTCQLQGRFRLNSVYQGGDVILGGLFQVHFFSFPRSELQNRTRTAILRKVSPEAEI